MTRRSSSSKLAALALCCALAAPGCATASGGRIAPAATTGLSAADRAVMSDYVQRLPAGSTVRIERAQGRRVRGTLMKATADLIIVQPKTRLPEPPIEIPMNDVLSVTPESGSGNGGNIAKAVGIGAAAGAGAALAAFFILIAAFAD